MPPPRRSRFTQSILPTGALGTSGTPPEFGGQGQTIQDLHPRGFWAAITAQPDATKNAYGFVAVDQGQPTTFPQFTGGAAAFGDGVALAAYEASGNKSVPTNGSAIVWLEPLAGVVGYGFTFSSSGGTSQLSTSLLAASFDIPTDANFHSTSLTLALPAAGIYYLFGVIYTLGECSSFAAFAAGILWRVIDSNGAVATDGDGAEVYALNTPAWKGNSPVSDVYITTGPTTLTLQGSVDSAGIGGTTWTVARIDAITALGLTRPTRLGYIKIR